MDARESRRRTRDRRPRTTPLSTALGALLAVAPPAAAGAEVFMVALAVLPAVPADTCNDPVGGPIDQRSAPRTLLFCEPGSHEHGADAPGPWIFSDGFESSDTAAWSAAVP